MEIKNASTEYLRGVLRDINRELIERDHIYVGYPNIEKDAEGLINKFKDRLRDASMDVLDEVYFDIGKYVESDSIRNIETDIINGLSSYSDSKGRFKYDFKRMRKLMLSENKEEIVKDINQDLLEEVESLKKALQQERNRNF